MDKRFNHIGKSHKVIKISGQEGYYVLQDGHNLAFDPSDAESVWALQWISTLEDDEFMNMVDHAARWNTYERERQKTALNG